MRPKLRIGLLLEGASSPYWASRMIERIIRSDHSEIVLLVIDGGMEKDLDPVHATESFLYDTYIWLDRRRNHGSPDPLVIEDLPAGLEKVGRVYLKRTRDPGRTLSPEAVKRIEDMDLDVLIDIGKVTPLGEISRCCRYGVWSFSPGDGEEYDGRPPGFWEIYDGVPVTGSHVRRIAGGATSMIYRSHSHTVRFSEVRNRRQLYLKGISFIPRLLEALYLRGEEAIIPVEGGGLAAWGPTPRPGPGNLDMLAFFFKRLPWNAAYLTKRTLFEERWALRYELGKRIPTTYDNTTLLVPPPRTWWGDPQAAQHDNDFYIFVEELELPRSRNHGHISVIKVNADGTHEPPVRVLERTYHLSYPFVFEWKGVHYMVPESSAARTIELFEAVDFPYHWRPVKNLMSDVFAVDTTIVRRNGRWWLFCNMKESEGAPINDELFLFHSDDLLGDHWEPHPLNPIVTDARNARPAGRIFEQDGILYRPSQDCSKCYGHAVNINRIVEMDESRYKEVQTAYLEPGMFPGASRVHTFSHVHGLTVVDTYISRPKFIPERSGQRDSS
ncbi:MAG: hypothetical protein ISF22_05990 [Methanomassiliicoccus sp.]|nr:hypothetical protein [Methanomassiliicoccus sp.]